MTTSTLWLGVLVALTTCATDFAYRDGPTARRLQAEGTHAFVTTSGTVMHATPGRTVLLATANGISGCRAGPDVLVQESYGSVIPC